MSEASKSSRTSAVGASSAKPSASVVATLGAAPVTQLAHPSLIAAMLRPHKTSMSPNLYAWMLRHGRFLKDGGTPVTVHEFTKGTAYSRSGEKMIGLCDPSDRQWFYGSRLNGVLCNGAAEREWAYPLPDGALMPVDNFWDRYLEIGRCAIDTTHEMGFIGDDARWSTQGMHRHCNWCGHEQQGVEVKEVRTLFSIAWSSIG